MIKVSISCTVYNHEKYLKKALDGFVNQKTSFDYEVIIHDDASTDSSAKIIREYEQKYPNLIKPIYQKENQYSKGVNIIDEFIVPKIQGEYIAKCEGDDYWIDENKLQQQVDFLDQHPEYVACVHNTIKKDLWHGKSGEMYCRESDCELTFADVIPKGSACYQTSSLMYRRIVRRTLPMYLKKDWGFGDYPLAIYLATVGKIWYINKTMSVYQFGTENSFTRSSGASVDKMLTVYDNIVKMLKEIDVETDGKYTDLIKPVILENMYYSTDLRGEYPLLRKYPLRDIYLKKSIPYKIKLFFIQYSGGIGKLLKEYKRKITYK